MAAHREVEDRQFGVVNIQPEFSTSGSGLEAAENNGGPGTLSTLRQTALVTGSSAGLGQPLPSLWLRQELDVICHGNSRPAEETCRKIERSAAERLPYRLIWRVLPALKSYLKKRVRSPPSTFW